MKFITGKKDKPRTMVLYGVHGVGKTTFASQAPGAIVVDVEDGCGDLDVARTPVIKNAEELNEALKVLVSTDHGYKTLVLDSADFTEAILHDAICKEHDVEAIQDIEWGKGKGKGVKAFRNLLTKLTTIRDHKGMDIIVIAHDKIERVEDPENASYDRHVPKMAYPETSMLLCEWPDEILFGYHSVKTKTVEGKFGKETTRALASTERLMRCNFKPTVVAKNRLSMPDVLPLDYTEYAKIRSERYATSV